MKNKILIILALLVVFSSLTSALCKTNNDFNINDEFNLCSGDCKFQLENLTYINCNSSISCFLTSSYANGTLIEISQPMEYNSINNYFNYSLGNTSNFGAGIYNHNINCYYAGGWNDPIYFQSTILSISSGSAPSGGRGGGLGYPEEQESVKVSGTTEEFLHENYKFIILGLFVLGLIIFMIVIIKNKRNR